ncbi:MAG: UDP-N-acetylglucosamine-N-acetylmuramyl-(pentapeptide) pyrophosphoryl-UDP N-acetylglucosamine transferase [candidate division TM6 bacterium GW2011_GWF2_28_16]|nr:MAG: UDP-N-acetylglucosamine-N-acetylmuramyl-(pentapeptide) pyrophosphoryl-UDP N-acetylglucosamine transferase [candidate division TM6 bacterium GW2011_GWF2_28_16]
MINNKTLFVVASGSGGHILPALILAKNWQKDNNGQVIFITGIKDLDKNILENNNFINKIIYFKLNNFPGKSLLKYPKFIWQFLVCFAKSYFLIKKYKKNNINNITVITTGGYLAIPVCLAAKKHKQEIILHELNVVPGKAIKFLADLANKINIVFEQTRKYFFKKLNNKIFVTNYPLRYNLQDKIFDRQELILKINNLNNINFNINNKTILILGGSQGSVTLNNYFKDFILQARDNNNLINNTRDNLNIFINNNINLNNINIIHQTGSQDSFNWENFYKDLNIPAIVFSYKQDLKDYYLISDLVFARAGAGTLFELEFFGKKSFIFPLKTVYTSHQVDNAKIMVERNKGLFEFKQPF